MDGSIEEIKDKRKTQAQNAAKVLGVDVYFLDIPDTEITVNRDTTSKLAYQVKKLKPDILITWNKPKKPGTGHPDHRYTNELVLDSITHARFDNPEDDIEPHRES